MTRCAITLGAQGDHTEPERLKLLTDHRRKVEAQIAERRKALRLIDHKISFYRTAIADGTAQ